MSREQENKGFICENCGQVVLPLKNGSYRNHCPFCLYSKHVDNKPGDRQSMCMALMKPIGIKNSSKKGIQIVHQCVKCGSRKVNIIAEYDSQADSIEEIIKLMNC
ncbi:hypothetical protein DW1_2828 [Proteiniborus sp. DW1]|uniref:RNHCP domain-containing protein n=1 Tax=Proteiniborus sp. DW1 TaxID=1889883 RepID=UPI00092DF95C|nr:RNHCP domain-containing protein [Proteiniborus sp. DW1]SCG84388.1 hypothetical protein DW1_2828 [Proteiniborus sp. DW1]